MISFVLASVAYWTGAAADFWTTRKALRLGLSERNPVVRWIIQRWGPEGVAAAKIAVYGVFVWLHIAGWSGVALALLLLGLAQAAAAWWNWRKIAERAA